MLLAIVMLILGLTLGASNGWPTPQFLIPFLACFILFPFFFFWESRQPTTSALLPSPTWHISNFTLFIVFALYIFSWWALSFIPLTETFLQVHNETSLVTAARMLPLGLSSGLMGLFLTYKPQYVSHPRWPIVFGLTAGLLGYGLFILSGGRVGVDYWKFTFPGMIIGSTGTMVISTATSVGIMKSVPTEMAGVAGAVLQSSLQLGPNVALSIQAGLLTVRPGNVREWVNVRAAFILVIAWGSIWLIGFLVFFKPMSKCAGASDQELQCSSESDK